MRLISDKVGGGKKIHHRDREIEEGAQRREKRAQRERLPTLPSTSPEVGPGGAALRRLSSPPLSPHKRVLKNFAFDAILKIHRDVYKLNFLHARKEPDYTNIAMPPLWAPSYGGGGRQGGQPLPLSPLLPPLCTLFYLCVSVVNLFSSSSKTQAGGSE